MRHPAAAATDLCVTAAMPPSAMIAIVASNSSSRRARPRARIGRLVVSLTLSSSPTGVVGVAFGTE